MLLSMEYTYMIIFPVTSFLMLFIVTEERSKNFLLLLIFAVVFHVWQRYIMIWGYGMATYDSERSFVTYMQFWGLVVSMAPAASVWWSWRIKWISNDIALLMFLLVYILTFLVYICALKGVDWWMARKELEEEDDFTAAGYPNGDPGYEEVIEQCSYSWWNVNPVYVLKHRHCPDLKGHECLSNTRCWPKNHVREGYFEIGKEFRHVVKSKFLESHADLVEF